MKIFNILLKSDKKRVSHVFKNLVKIPNLEIFPAIEGKSNQLEFELGGREIHPEYLKFCKRGELACLLTHLSLWRKIVNEEIEQAVILEDDADFESDFLDKFELPPNYDFIYLFVHPDSKKEFPEAFKNLVQGYSTYGTVAYIITKNLAKELIDFFSKRIVCPLDESIDWYLSNMGKKYYCVKENVVQTIGKLYHSNSEKTELDSAIGQTSLYQGSTPEFSYYLDEKNYLCYPCCDLSDNLYLDSEHTLDKSMKKYSNMKEVVGFNSEGWIKSSLDHWVVNPDVSLYVKSKKREAILLTGGAGYIGAHCVLEIILSRWEDIVIVDDLSNSNLDNLSKIQNLGNVYIYIQDLRDTDKLDQVFKKHNITKVIHLASYKSVGDSVANPIKYYQNNLSGLLVLIECMKKYSVKNIIFSSSTTVYGQPETLPLTENSKINLLNPYGKTKYFCEEILRDTKDLNTICLRYFNPVGRHPSKMLNESPKDTPNNLFPFIMSVISGKEKYLKIYGRDYPTKDGTGVRDYIHVVDLAQAHLTCLDYFPKMKEHFEVFNLGTEKGYSVLEIVSKFNEYLKVDYNGQLKDLTYVFVERRPGDSSEVYTDCSKAEKILGWKSKLTIDEMIQDSL